MIDKAILCVDDEPIILRSLRDQINKHLGDKYRCEIAESADEAWEIIEELELDKAKILIIVSDWLMPGICGDEFLIKVHQFFPHIVTVLLTGHAKESAIQQLQEEAELYAYIPKPWQESVLINTIKSGLEQYHVKESNFMY
jgi:CheY-like chemotaxis protein